MKGPARVFLGDPDSTRWKKTQTTEYAKAIFTNFDWNNFTDHPSSRTFLQAKAFALKANAKAIDICRHLEWKKFTNQKRICFLFIIPRVILKCIINENKGQCACKLALSFVDLGTSLVQKDSVETESSSLLGSSLEFDFCFCDNWN